MKRFWDEARVEEAEGGLAVLLDGRPVRLPGGGALRVENPVLAQALAAEWQAAGGAKGRDFKPEDIPLTRLVGTAQEKVAPNPAPMVEGIAQYSAADLLCYRSEDPRLAAIEALEWDPWLEWSARELGATLLPATGIIHVAQPSRARTALRDAVAACDSFELTALGNMVPQLGSLVLGLAFVRGAIDAAEAHRISLVDETFQEEFWGVDEEAQKRRRLIAAEMALAERMLHLARSRG
jgi:chaperone required for assembly of F1-ATPase